MYFMESVQSFRKEETLSCNFLVFEMAAGVTALFLLLLFSLVCRNLIFFFQRLLNFYGKHDCAKSSVTI